MSAILRDYAHSEGNCCILRWFARTSLGVAGSWSLVLERLDERCAADRQIACRMHC